MSPSLYAGVYVVHIFGPVCRGRNITFATSQAFSRFPVDAIDAAVDQPNARGVVTRIYDHSDDRAIVRPPTPEYGPPICRFKDPAGTVLSLLAS